jgi:ACS family hexuronate transporter-like MFS transporter
VSLSLVRSFKRDRNFTPLPDSDLQVLSENSRTRAWTLTGLATVALLTTLIHRQTLAALAATVTRDLALSDLEYGWLSTGMAATFLLASLPAARLTHRIGPQIALAITVVATSLVIGLHAVASSFLLLLILRMAMGCAIASAMPSATQTVHRVLPFKDRARGIALLYLGSSAGSAVCAPLAISLESRFGWRWTFVAVAALGMIWIPIWTFAAAARRAKNGINSLGPAPQQPVVGLGESVLELARRSGVMRGALLVAGAAPISLIMLIWAAKYLVRDHTVQQADLGKFLWLPALMFGGGSLAFGELRARSAKNRSSARPPRRLVVLAAMLACTIVAVPLCAGPWRAIAIAGISMFGAGGLYTLATSDMLAHTPRESVAATAGLSTVTQSFVYIVASPIIGKCVEHFGNYHWVLIGAGVWVLPCVLVWLAEASMNS